MKCFLLPIVGRVSVSALLLEEHSAPVGNISAVRPSKLTHLFDVAEQHAQKTALSQPNLRAGAPSSKATGCGLFSGLISADLSSRCCFAVQVVAQRALESYGLAQPCQKSWECAADGITPLEDFEEKALAQMCGEPSCAELVTEAMQSNWMTRKGSKFFSKACDTTMSVAEQVHLLESDLEDTTGLESEEEPKHDSNKDKKKDSKKSKKGKKKDKKKNKKSGASCFPGIAKVQVQGKGSKTLSGLLVGDLVLAQGPSGDLIYEPLLGFLHKAPGSHDFITVQHERGIFRATENHIVFAQSEGKRVDKLAGSLSPGEFVFAADTTVEPSRVTSISRSEGTGAYAPLTPSGTIVVDGVVASNYATPSMTANLPHKWAHIAFLPVRLYHSTGLRSLVCLIMTCEESSKDQDEFHPYVSALYALKLHKILEHISPVLV